MKDLNDSFVKVVIGRALEGKLTNDGAAAKLGISKRYVQKLKAKMRGEPKCGFSHGNKGRAPANRATIEKEAAILGLYTGKYDDKVNIFFTILGKISFTNVG